MYIKYPKSIFHKKEIMSEEFVFPCLVFIMTYKSSENIINTTIGCILNEFSINPISRNTDKIKSCLKVLAKHNLIYLNTDLDKINTPLILTVNDFDTWIAIHDFEIEELKDIILSNNVSYKLADLFTSIKQNSHNCNPIEININRYGSVNYSYVTLANWSGVMSHTTLTKYITILGKTKILDIKKTIEDNDNIKKIHHTYSFKEIV